MGLLRTSPGSLSPGSLGKMLKVNAGLKESMEISPEAGNPDAQICEMDLSSPRVEASELDSVTVEELNVWNKR